MEQQKKAMEDKPFSPRNKKIFELKFGQKF
jgi:hypothetical protein